MSFRAFPLLSPGLRPRLLPTFKQSLCLFLHPSHSTKANEDHGGSGGTRPQGQPRQPHHQGGYGCVQSVDTVVLRYETDGICQLWNGPPMRALGNICMVLPDRHGPRTHMPHRLCVDTGLRM
ncbi:hypothetical protein SeMB42_g03582 [Synchytrium endobioticum]|uniref:Uncharacterized protein n=1 Tax=Synchytrium endobioticum TaxID=286115 RepID=A0A507D5H3_9FUNG|nr:hypothetical protein SeMB42_g03582 [Synchytrium endobioticum]